MRIFRELLAKSESEEGHAVPSIGALIAALGVLGLGIGAANDTGWLSLGGGIVAAAGILVYTLAQHLGVDWDVFRRLEKLEEPKE